MSTRELRGPHDRWDRFRRADSSTLGGLEAETNRSWAEFGSGNLSISGQKVISTAAQGTWSLAHVTGGNIGINADHYCEGTFELPASGSAGAMVFVRKADNTTQTFYAGEIRQAGGSATLYITEWTAGSRVELTSMAFGVAGQTVHIIIEVRGSLLILYTTASGVDTQQLQVSDSSIAADKANTYPGFGLDGAAKATVVAFGQLADTFAAPAGATFKSGSRDPYQHPFVSESVWNRPVGSGATDTAISTTGPMGSGVNVGPAIGIHVGIFQAASDDPWVPLYVRPGSDLAQSVLWDWAQVPATIVDKTSTSTNSPQGPHTELCVVQPDGKWTFRMYIAKTHTGAQGAGWSGSGMRSGARWFRADESGRWTYFVGNPEAGDVTVTGKIRAGEINDGVFHCLTALIAGKNSQGDYVWPANNASPSTPATTSNLRMGALLRIPPSYNVDGLANVQARNLARAMQNYGVYIDDEGATDQQIKLRCAQDAIADFAAIGVARGTYNLITNLSAPFWQDLQTALRQLRVVTNNTPTSIGGGGTLRDSLPALIASGPLPAAPTTLIASAGSPATSSVNLTWSAPSPQGDTLHLEQERVTTPAEVWREIEVLVGSATSKTVTGLNAGVEYNFRINARNAQGDSAYSNTANITTAATPAPPATPGNPTISALAYDQVRASWDNVTGETGFELEISKNGGPFVLVASPAADVLTYDYTDPDPADGQNVYQMQVRAVNANGPSEWATSGTVTTPARVPPPVPADPGTTPVSRISEKWSNFNAWAFYTAGAESTSNILSTRVAAPAGLGYALSALKINVTPALASAGETARQVTLADLSEVHLWTEWLIPGGFAAPASPGVIWMNLRESSSGNRVCAIYLVDTDTLKAVIDTTGGAVTYTLGTGVSTNTRHQLRISARVGTGSFLRIEYDTVEVVDATPAFSAALITQLRVGASVPAGWTGIVYDGRLELNADPLFVTGLDAAGTFPSNPTLPSPPVFPDNPPFPSNPPFPT